jgi:hypothetical protein
VRALSREAAQFEFRGSESYVRWVLDHRALVLSNSDAVADRLTTLESRLQKLEETADGEREAASETDEMEDAAAVQDVIDQWLVVARQADDDEVEQAVSRVERNGGRASDGRDRRPREGAIEGTLDDDRGD